MTTIALFVWHAQPYFVRARAWGCYPRDESAEHPLRQVVQKFKYGRKSLSVNH